MENYNLTMKNSKKWSYYTFH